MTEFKVLVCGGRDYDNKERLFGVLDKALAAARTAAVAERPFVLIHGGAPGADRRSNEWATARKVDDVRVYKADWSTYKNAAGPIRNRLMFTSESPDVIIAFRGGNGTADMIKIGKKAGVPVYEVRE